MTEADTHEILSALLDREPVDPEQLADVLERPEARVLLVDFVRLRSALHTDADGPARTVVPATAGRRSFSRPLLGLAAAVLLVTTGALLGSRFASTGQEPPPEPTRVVRLVPSPMPGGGR